MEVIIPAAHLAAHSLSPLSSIQPMFDLWPVLSSAGSGSGGNGYCVHHGEGRKPFRLASGFGEAAGMEGRAWGSSARCLGMRNGGRGGEDAMGSSPRPGDDRALVLTSLLEKGRSLFAPPSRTGIIITTVTELAHTH